MFLLFNEFFKLEALADFYYTPFKMIYYAPHSSPEGARRCCNRSNACGALVFLSKFKTVL